MTSETLKMTLAWLAGAALGVMFFGGLWWTVRKGVSSRRPAFLFLGSLLLRTGFVLVGLYFAGHGDWRRLVACLVGFIIARFCVIRLTRTPIEHSHFTPKEAPDAP